MSDAARALALLRAIKLSPARRKEIATKASHARPSYKRKAKATAHAQPNAQTQER